MSNETRSRKAGKKEWVVTIRAVVIKELILSDCSKEQAWKEPYEYAVDEQEGDTIDWEVQKVEPNE